jgi:hypothetical protein
VTAVIPAPKMLERLQGVDKPCLLAQCTKRW